MISRAKFSAEEGAFSTERERERELSMKEDSMVRGAFGHVLCPVHLNTKEKLA